MGDLARIGNPSAGEWVSGGDWLDHTHQSGTPAIGSSMSWGWPGGCATCLGASFRDGRACGPTQNAVGIPTTARVAFTRGLESPYASIPQHQAPREATSLDKTRRPPTAVVTLLRKPKPACAQDARRMVTRCCQDGGLCSTAKHL